MYVCFIQDNQLKFRLLGYFLYILYPYLVEEASLERMLVAIDP